MRILICLTFFFLFASDLPGQGFSTFSGRNHPELDWQVAETEHFEIMYPARLSGIEIEAAPIAEETYKALSSNLNVTFDEKIRIYLSDEDEITNGFAVSIGSGYTNIWVHVNDAAETWTGPEKWLRKVIAHELTHIFHYRAVRTNLGYLAFLFGDPIPRFWAEGLAQYETETWDAMRGDRWLRTAVLDDQLSYSDGRSIWNGRLLYALGNSQMRYFADQYGDSTLAKLLAHRKRVLFGLGKVHDFNTAFREVVDKPYRRFFDDWRRHMNVYYNTIAGQMELPDSLNTDPLSLPGQYYYDIRYSPDTSRVAILSFTSLQRPIRRLFVVDRSEKTTEIIAEGAIQPPVSWSPDGNRIAFARTTRGQYGSLLNDLFMVDRDGGNLRRLTHSRRAVSPTFSPDPNSNTLAFVGSSEGTANIFLLDIQAGTETPLTSYTGDVQISSVRWSPDGRRLVYAVFDEDGSRDLILLDPETREQKILLGGEADERIPIWSPDGKRIAFTSLQDRVPNVFIHDVDSATTRRATFLATGATALDWLPPDSAHASGTLIVTSAVSKERDRAFRIDASRNVSACCIEIPAGYAGWTSHRPPNEVPVVLPPDPSLIAGRYPYRSWKNVTHAATLAVPYYDNPDDWGLVGLTTWMEPLGKHIVSFLGGISFPSPSDKSLFAATYINNQWYPTVGLSLYRMPGSTRFYGDDLLVENYMGGDVTVNWPLDWRARPFVSTLFGLRLRYVDIDPLNEDDLEGLDNLPLPQSGLQADLQMSLVRRKQRPYAHSAVHPLDGLGIRFQVDAASRILGADSQYLRGEIAAYGIFRSVGLQRIFLYGRAQAQTGEAFVQNYIGISGRDDIQIGIPGFIPFALGETDRVRGYNTFALGNRVLFGTAEYRILLLSDLQTRLLGLVSLGSTSLAGFLDAALVWSDSHFDDATRRIGAGGELKNELRIGGILSFSHALGVARPLYDPDYDYEVYYRIRASVPF